MGELGGDDLAGLFCHDLESLVAQCCSVAWACARELMLVTTGMGSSLVVPIGMTADLGVEGDGADTAI